MGRASPKLFSINLEDPISNKIYKISVSAKEIQQLENDPYFASKKLEEVKSLEYAKQISEENPESVEALEFEMDINESKVVNVSGVPKHCRVEDSVFKWPHEATLMLIEEYRANESNFISGKVSQKKLWDNISDQLNIYGYKITGPQCQSKFSGLKRTYKKIRYHSNKSGNSAKTWPYFTLIDDLLGAKTNMTPAATCSSTGKRTRSNSTCSSVNSDNELYEAATIVKRSKIKSIDRLLEVLEEHSSIQEANKERRFRELLEFKERKMNENLELKERALDLLAQIVNSKQNF